MIKWQNPANADLKLKNTNVRFSFLLLWRKKTLQSLDRAKEASGFVSKSNIFHDFDFTPGSARKAPRASISSCSRRNTRRTLSKRPSGRCSIVTEIRMMVENYPENLSIFIFHDLQERHQSLALMEKLNNEKQNKSELEVRLIHLFLGSVNVYKIKFCSGGGGGVTEWGGRTANAASSPPGCSSNH